MNKTLQNIFIVLGVALALYCGFYIAQGFFTPIKQPVKAYRDSAPAEIIKPKVDTQVNRDTFKEDYINGCAPDGTNRSYCECSYEYLVNQNSKEWLVRESIKYYESGKMSEGLGDAIIGAVEEC